MSALWHWLAEGRVGFMGALVIVAAVVWPTWTVCSESTFRISGLVLQLAGMVFAIRGLLAIRAHFGKPLLRHLLRDWLKRIPRWKSNRTVRGVGAVISNEAAMHARGYVWTPDKAEKPLEQRVEAILKNLERMRDDLQNHAKSLDELRLDHERHKVEIQQTAGRFESSIRIDLDKLHTADVLVSLVGLVWLTIGIVLSTLAPELAAMLDCS